MQFVAKSPRPMSTSTGVCLMAVVEVDVCVASEPHGLDERGSNESATVMVCSVVGPVAVGCSWARFPAILWSRKILSLFRPSWRCILQRVCDAYGALGLVCGCARWLCGQLANLSQPNGWRTLARCGSVSTALRPAPGGPGWPRDRAVTATGVCDHRPHLWLRPNRVIEPVESAACAKFRQNRVNRTKSALVATVEHISMLASSCATGSRRRRRQNC